MYISTTWSLSLCVEVVTVWIGQSRPQHREACILNYYIGTNGEPLTQQFNPSIAFIFTKDENYHSASPFKDTLAETRHD